MLSSFKKITNYEKKLIASEWNGTCRDVIAILGGVINAVSILTIVGYNFITPPIRWMVDKWQDVFYEIWTTVLFLYPYELKLHNTNILTLFLVISAMFLRGSYANYTPLKKFTKSTQVLFSRVTLLFLMLCAIYGNINTLINFDLPVLSNGESSRFSLIFSFVILLLIFLFIFEMNTRLLLKTKIVQKISKKPLWIFTFFFILVFTMLWGDTLIQVSEQILHSDPNAYVEIQKSQGWQEALIIFLLFWTCLCMLAFSFWYLRALYSVVISTIGILVLDHLWKII